MAVFDPVLASVAAVALAAERDAVGPTGLQRQASKLSAAALLDMLGVLVALDVVVQLGAVVVGIDAEVGGVEIAGIEAAVSGVQVEHEACFGSADCTSAGSAYTRTHSVLVVEESHADVVSVPDPGLSLVAVHRSASLVANHLVVVVCHAWVDKVGLVEELEAMLKGQDVVA